MEANKSVALRPFYPRKWQPSTQPIRGYIWMPCKTDKAFFFCQESTIDCSVLTRLTREHGCEGNIWIESGSWKECRRNKPLNVFFPCGALTQFRIMASPYGASRSHWLDTAYGRTPMDEWSARHRDLYLKALQIQNRQNFMLPSGIRTRNRCKRAAAYPRLRTRGYWDRQLIYIAHKILLG